MGFYLPKTINIDDLPVIFYPCTGLEEVIERGNNSVEKHIRNVYEENSEILKNKGQYHILIIWNDGKDIMMDSWIYGKIDSWGSGPLVDVKIFRNFRLETNIGVSAGDGLILLGKEEEHRRKVGNFEEYLESRPELLEELSVREYS